MTGTYVLMQFKWYAMLLSNAFHFRHLWRTKSCKEHNRGRTCSSPAQISPWTAENTTSTAGRRVSVMIKCLHQLHHHYAFRRKGDDNKWENDVTHNPQPFITWHALHARLAHIPSPKDAVSMRAFSFLPISIVHFGDLHFKNCYFQ